MEIFVANAKVMSKGQVTIPKEVREALGVNSGDKITFIVKDGNVRVINTSLYAMQIMQQELENAKQENF